MKKTIYLLLLGALAMAACNPYSHLKSLAQVADMDYGYPVQYADLGPDLRIAYTDGGTGQPQQRQE